jgi:serpin B
MKPKRRMRQLTSFILLTALLTTLLGCTASPPDGQGPRAQIAFAQSDAPRVTTPSVGAADRAQLIAGNQAFALDLYRYLADRAEGNLFLSPHSISVALAMTYAGARGMTEVEMAETLHFTLPQDQLHAAFNEIDLALGRRGAEAEGKDGEGFRLHIVNALWGQQDHAFQKAYLDALARNYGTGLYLVDFVNDTETARNAINDWVSQQTESRIEDLIPPGALDALTRLVLTNAIYFNAAWAEPFSEEATREGDFFLLDGGSVQVPLMQQVAAFRYAGGAGYQAIELPYDGGELSMVILLPDTGRFEAFEQSLDQPLLASILGGLSYQQIDLTMPRFEMASEFSLADALSALGMPQAFTDAADFSGIDGTQDLLISGVLHQAFVSVDEAGTEAAAATAIIVGVESSPAEPQQVRIDRPFIFMIRDIETGALLFAGRTLNPAES